LENWPLAPHLIIFPTSEVEVLVLDEQVPVYKAYLQGRPMGACLLRTVIFKITEIASIFDVIFSGLGLCINFVKKMSWGNILGDFFTNSSGHPAYLHEIRFFRARHATTLRCRTASSAPDHFPCE
jgi:hypothetical protein